MRLKSTVLITAIIAGIGGSTLAMATIPTSPHQVLMKKPTIVLDSYIGVRLAQLKNKGEE